MKVLFIANVQKSLAMNRFANDYMRDLLYYGLLETPEIELYSSSPISTVHSQYRNDFHKDTIWGLGFTTCWLTDREPNVPDNVEELIKNRYFELIIYGDIRTSADYIDLVNKNYEPHRVFLVDGRDDGGIHRSSEKYLYFKRELSMHKENVRPISFAMPTCKIVSNSLSACGVKEQFLATSVPNNKSTYIFKDENSYYEDMQRSFFGITMQKNGWDCMRHYELIANGCVPLFFNIDRCPDQTLTIFPKDLCREAFNAFKHFDFLSYMTLNSAFMSHLLRFNTTKSLAHYVLSHA